MAITNAQRAKINKMNRASQDVSLGTIVQSLQTGSAATGGYIKASGSYTVLAGDVTGSLVTIATGLTGLKGHIVDVYTNGSNVAGSALKVLNSGSNIRIWCNSEGSSVILNQSIYWMVW